MKDSRLKQRNFNTLTLEISLIYYDNELLGRDYVRSARLQLNYCTAVSVMTSLCVESELY